jgi:hypothetical protein
VSKPRVFVSRIIPEEGLAPIRAACDVEIWQDELPPPRDALLKAIEGCDGVLTLLTDKVDDGVPWTAPGPQPEGRQQLRGRLRQRRRGRAMKRGVAVGNTPGVLPRPPRTSPGRC